jgi:hypothetical protein
VIPQISNGPENRALTQHISALLKIETAVSLAVFSPRMPVVINVAQTSAANSVDRCVSPFCELRSARTVGWCETGYITRHLAFQPYASFARHPRGYQTS